MRKISEWIIRFSNLPVFSVLFLIFLFLELWVFPQVQSKIDSINQTSHTQIPDLQLGFSAESLYQIIDQMNMETQAFYYRTELTADLLFPLVYSLMFAVLISLLFLKKEPTSRFKLLNLIPFITATFDFGENILVTKLLRIYPYRNPMIADAAGLFNLLKWGTLLLTVILCVYGIYLQIKTRKKHSISQ